MQTAVILAGGKGTRLGLSDIPKPMMKIAEVPLLERQIRIFVSQGVKKIFLLCGHLGEVIFDYFKDGSSFGVCIHYIFDPYPLGTAGSLSLLKGIIKEDFFLAYGDVYFDVDLAKMTNFHLAKNSLLTALVHPSSHIQDSDLVVMDNTEKIIKIYNRHEEKPRYYHNIGNAAFYLLSPKVLEEIPYGVPQDFFQDVVPSFIKKGLSIFGYLSAEFLMDLGTKERKAKLENYFTNHSPILSKHRRAFFLDRDGVINKYVPDIKDIEDIEILPGVSKALKILKDHGFLTIIVTNQPGIAKGFFNEQELDEMHKKIETLLAKEGAYIDRIYYCPHHPDRGFKGERTELKKVCDCRKPATALLEEALLDLSIDKKNSFMVGDSVRDTMAGKSIGIKTIFIKGQETQKELDADYTFSSLLESVEYLLLENILS